MPITRDFRATVWTRAQKDARYRSAMLTEAINELLTGDLGAGKAMLRDYVNATITSKVWQKPPANLVRACSACWVHGETPRRRVCLG